MYINVIIAKIDAKIAAKSPQNRRKIAAKSLYFLTSSLVRYFYLPHDGTCGFKGVSEDLTGDAG